ncbi:hypothetical protein BCR34DRAFT_1281 [Clohesyomyces aquaticus]|uniref:Uncharacterized protein n=1 Tax=Clohesyomyces aquaticus TaxID=1231657 RepID=A0A1Y2AB50_9PLEO|nr:hypothetical protein BCR34DRAFT_1281 [Clohesyomyces aquaticus]
MFCTVYSSTPTLVVFIFGRVAPSNGHHFILFGSPVNHSGNMNSRLPYAESPLSMKTLLPGDRSLSQHSFEPRSGCQPWKHYSSTTSNRKCTNLTMVESDTKVRQNDHDLVVTALSVAMAPPAVSGFKRTLIVQDREARLLTDLELLFPDLYTSSYIRTGLPSHPSPQPFLRGDQ